MNCCGFVFCGDLDEGKRYIFLVFRWFRFGREVNLEVRVKMWCFRVVLKLVKLIRWEFMRWVLRKIKVLFLGLKNFFVKVSLGRES